MTIKNIIVPPTWRGEPVEGAMERLEEAERKKREAKQRLEQTVKTSSSPETILTPIINMDKTFYSKNKIKKENFYE